MELLLWRHAEALNGSPDHARELSPHGREQAGRVAAWLNVHAPENLRLLVSPAVRTRQTAGFFRREMDICEALAIDAKPADIFSILKGPIARTPLLLVGHQPLLGRIAARLSRDAPHRPIPDHFHKGALWWLSGEPEGGKMKLRQVVDAEKLLLVSHLKPEDEKCYNHAVRLEAAGKYRQAFKRFRRLAKRGNSDAMTYLAHLYDYGHGVKPSFEQSVKWELKVAESGESSGLLNLGVMYRRIGDIRSAKKWFEKALWLGDGEAALEIAKMYLISDIETGRVKDYLHKALALGRLTKACEGEIQRLLDELGGSGDG
jgi:phosphohistidine phosphatase